MIGTIFYFPANKDQYERNKGDISPRTISFVPTGDGVGDIYKDGIKYGSSAKGDKGDKGDAFTYEDFTPEQLEGLRVNGYTKEEVDEIIDGVTEDFNQEINTTNGRVDEVSRNLDNVVERERDNINQMIEDILNGKNFVDGWQDGWNENLKAYLIQAGILGEDGVSKGWAYLETKYDEIRAEVNALSTIQSGDGEVDMEAIQALIDARIENNEAIAQLKARYALTDADEKVLKWLSAGLLSQANANKAITEVFASAEDVATNTSAISALRTTVEKIDGDYVTETELNSKVSDKVTESISGLATKNSLDTAVGQLSSRLTTVEDDNETTKSGLSALNTEVTNLKDSGLITKSSLISSITEKKDDVADVLSTAGLVNEAKLNEAKTELAAQINDIDTTTQGNVSAISTLQGRVSNIEENGAPASESSVLSAINAYKDDVVTTLSSAGLINSATLDEAVTNLGTRINGVEGNANTANNGVSSLSTRVQTLEDAGYLAESSLVSAITDKKDQIITQAGLVNTAALNEAKTELKSEVDSAKASFTTELSNVDGKIATATAGMVVQNDLDDYVQKASVIASINSSGESNVKIDADKIDINGVTFTKDNISNFDTEAANAAKGAITAAYINGLDITAKNISSDTTISNALNATSGTIGGFNIGADYILGQLLNGEDRPEIRVGSTVNQGAAYSVLSPTGFRTENVDRRLQTSETTNAINSDGSGQLANGNIAWDENGVFTMSQSFIDSIFKALATGQYSTWNDEGSTHFSNSTVSLSNGELKINTDTNVTSQTSMFSSDGFSVSLSQSGVLEGYESVSISESGITITEESEGAFDEDNINNTLHISASGITINNSAGVTQNVNLGTHTLVIEGGIITNVITNQ